MASLQEEEEGEGAAVPLMYVDRTGPGLQRIALRRFLNPCVISNLIYSTHSPHDDDYDMQGGRGHGDRPFGGPGCRLSIRPSVRPCMLLSDLRFVINVRLLKRTSSERFTAN